MGTFPPARPSHRTGVQGVCTQVRRLRSTVRTSVTTEATLSMTSDRVQRFRVTESRGNDTESSDCSQPGLRAKRYPSPCSHSSGYGGDAPGTGPPFGYGGDSRPCSVWEAAPSEWRPRPGLTP